MSTLNNIKTLLLAGLIGISGLLAGCGGGGAGGDPVTATSISGTAATGAAMSGSTVTVKDANGRIVGTTKAAANGTFTISITTPTTFVGPFMLMADPTPNSISSGDEHYSFLPTLDEVTATHNRVNITSVTSLILYEATKRNLATVFSTPSLFKDLTDVEFIQARDNLANQFNVLGGLTNQDFFGQSFSANGADPYDVALDTLGVVNVEFSGDTPTLKNESNAVVTYDPAVPLFPIASLSVTAGVPQQVADNVSYNLLSATVTNTQNAPAKGVIVNFTTSAGALYNSEKTTQTRAAVTDSNGVARLYLRAGALTATTITITAESRDSAASGTTTVSFIPSVSDIVALNAAPSTVAPGSVTVLTAAVLDSNLNKVADGQTITFKRVTTTGEESIGTSTTVDGFAILTYTVGLTPGTENIKAYSVNGKSATATLTITSANNAVTNLTLTSASSSMVANGVSTTTLTATARDSSGKGVPGAAVVFTKSAGDFVTTATTETDINGVATATLKAGTEVLTAVISVSVNGITANTNINFTAGAAAIIAAHASPDKVRPAGLSTITFAVVDGNGNAVANEPVTLGFDASIASVDPRGSGTPSLSATSGITNANGLLIVTYTAGAKAGKDYILARTSNGFPSYTEINVSPDNIVIGSVTTTASNGNIPVGTVTSAGTSVIRALVKDSAGAIVTGVGVTFRTSAGTFRTSTGTSSSTATFMTDATGYAQATLTAGSQVLTARVEASVSGVIGATNVNFIAGTPNTVKVSAAPSTVNPGGTSTIFAYVVDAELNPVVGETVTFSIPVRGSGLPTLSVATAVTDNNGLASVTYTAGASTGTDSVKALTSNGKFDSENVVVNPTASVVGSITLLSGATTLPADGRSTAIMRATVLTDAGAPASGINVTFTTSGGILSRTTSVPTNASGIAEVTLTSPIQTGTITVIAEASGFLASQDVIIIAGQPLGAKFVLSANPTVVNAGGVSALTAIVLDANNNPVVGQTVTFTIMETATKTGGSISPATAITNANGIALASYTGGSTLGTDTLQAALVGNGKATATVEVTGNVLTALSIATSRTSVKSDNSETAIITVTALSSGNVVVPGVTISFSADGGQLSASQVVTNANGQASVNLQPGTLDKSNRVINVTASAAGVDEPVLIPVRVTGSTVTLDSTSTTLTAGGVGTLITVTARDASGLGIYNTEVTFGQTGTGSLTIVPASGNTDVNGQFAATVTGVTAGTRTLTATALAADASQDFNILAGSTFGISTPAIDPAPMTTSGTLAFTVNAPTQTHVRFATTIGTWSECPGLAVCTRAVAAGKATATLTSTTSAGIAGIQVDGLNAGGNVTGTDLHTVAITSAVASSISLQASAANVQPSTGGVLNTVTLIATLRDANGQPVGNVPVAFTLLNTTGGGESLSPVIKLSSDGVSSTDPLGQARTTFTSGSLPSGQSSFSIQIKATAVGSTAPPATVNIVIGGTAGSVVIGQASHFTDNPERTAYIVPMAVQVSDSNGNPVPGGTVVSLSVWPTDYAQGFWVSASGDGTKCAPVYSAGSPHPNEDANENLILDYYGDLNKNCAIDGTEVGPASEDANCDGRLTPGNSTGGSLPSSVVTDANGLVNFNLNYLKQYAAWITVRVRATALVQGTETTGNLSFTLPWLKVDSDSCVLPHSPFN